MGHKRKEGLHYASKPILQWMRDHAKSSDGQTLCVSAEAAEKMLHIIEAEISERVRGALLVKTGLGDRAMCVSHFTLAEDARRKRVEDAPAQPVIVKRRRGRPSKTTNK
jgi:hypothetical protein